MKGKLILMLVWIIKLKHSQFRITLKPSYSFYPIINLPHINLPHFTRVNIGIAMLPEVKKAPMSSGLPPQAGGG